MKIVICCYKFGYVHDVKEIGDKTQQKNIFGYISRYVGIYEITQGYVFRFLDLANTDFGSTSVHFGSTSVHFRFADFGSTQKTL